MKKFVLLALATVLTAACGTRLPDSAFVETGTAAKASDATGAQASGVDDLGDADVTSTTLADLASGAGGGQGAGRASGPTGAAGGVSAVNRPNQASDIGIAADSVTLGSIVAENGILGDAFAPAARGIRAWAAFMNSRGGINGRRIILKTCDDTEQRNKALECAQRLVEQDKVFAIVAANTRAMGGAAEYLNSKAVPVIGIPITNSYYRYPHFWSAYANGYARDGKTVGYKGQIMYTSGIYRWFKTHLNLTKAAVFAYDIDESKQAGDAFAHGMQLEGFDVTTYIVSFAAPSFDQAVADMQRNGVQFIMDAMDDGANRKLCDAMARRNFSVPAKVSTVVAFGDKVGSAYNETCRNSIYIPGESTPYTSTNIPAVAEFRAAFAKYQPGKEMHQWALEAWTEGMLVAEAVKKMGPTPTRKGLEDYLRTVDSFTANGMLTGMSWKPIDYSKPTLPDCFTIAHWQDSQGGWIRATETFPYCYPDAKNYGAVALEQGN